MRTVSATSVWLDVDVCVFALVPQAAGPGIASKKKSVSPAGPSPRLDDFPELLRVDEAAAVEIEHLECEAHL